MLVKVKGRIEALQAEKIAKPDTKVAFSEEAPGALHVIRSSDNGESEERLQDEVGRFLVSDFNGLEVAFVAQIHAILFGE